MADLRARGLEFETFDLGDPEMTDQIVVVPNNYPLLLVQRASVVIR